MSHRKNGIEFCYLFSARTRVWRKGFAIMPDGAMSSGRYEIGYINSFHGDNEHGERLSPDKNEAIRRQDFGTTIYVCPIYWCNGCRRWHHLNDDHWRELIDLEYLIEKYPIDTRFLVASAWALKLRDRPAFHIKRCPVCKGQRPTNTLLRSYSGNGRTDRINIGPWGIDPKDSKTIELKQWIWSEAKTHKSNKSIIKRSVQRRLRKFGLSESERQFFATMFGVKEITTWSKNKRTHEYTSKVASVAG